MTFLFAFDVVAVLAFAVLVAAILKPPTRPSFLVGAFVLVWADIVLTAEVLSLLRLINPWAFAAGHAALAGLALVLWSRRGRPRPAVLTLPPRSAVAASLRSAPDLWALGSIVGLGYALQAVIILLVPPNNLDSMVYHLAKVAHWIKNGSLRPWMTPCLHQTIYPFNVEIGSLWSMVFLHRDVLAGFVQWTAAGAAMVSVFGLARLLGFSRPRALFASLLFLTLPMIVLQATTTQTDLAVGAMSAATVFLLLLGLRTSHRGLLALSGAALGLLLGMKLTPLMVLPGLGLGLLYVTLTRRPRSLRPLVFWGAACLAGFVVLGAFNYVQAWFFTRSLPPGMIDPRSRVSTIPEDELDPTARLTLPAEGSDPLASNTETRSTGASNGPRMDEYQDATPEPPSEKPEHPRILDRGNLQITAEPRFRADFARNNIARDLYGFADATGLPPALAEPIVRARMKAGRYLFKRLSLRTAADPENRFRLPFTFKDPKAMASEAGSFFGPLGFLLILPVLFYGLVAGLARRDLRLVLSLSFIGFMVLMAGTTGWQPFRGRYYCTVVPLIVPLAAALYGRGWLRITLRGLVAALASLVMIVTILTNVQKPLIGPDAIWPKTSDERRSLRMAAQGFPYKTIQAEIPDGVTVGAILRSTNMEYPLFGPRLGRNVVPIFPRPERVTASWLKSCPYDYLLVNSGVVAPLQGPFPPEYRIIRRYPYTIIIRRR